MTQRRPIVFEHFPHGRAGPLKEKPYTADHPE
jgi:hypothetical protein